ncbi:germinal-center associated nuclear protein [Lampris incognitus]|uniref:germinal-center associated nuclear protein n=1 Tax=Lampris incognitus TaxID=2546036 RepID=UPI0024B5AF0F|nr:germinal-center associated nuclear protein [Lampris incognitus]
MYPWRAVRKIPIFFFTMNPNNLFGSSQGGAFQAPSNTNKTGLFQSFGQQTTSSQTQSISFLQSPAFGQSSLSNQQPTLGNTIFGQTPSFGQRSVFGQSSTQSPTVTMMSQAPAFGQPSFGQSSSVFGSGSTTLAFGQAGRSNQSSVFRQAAAFGQPSGFSQQASTFVPSQTSSGSTPTIGSSQPMSIGQPPFGQPLSSSVTSNTLSSAQSVTQSRGFAPPEFSFKPSNEVLFKPIFSASPQPANPQTVSGSDQPFGSSAPQTSSNTMESSNNTSTGFSQLTGTKSGPLGFSFSQPNAAPSIPVQKDPLTTVNSSDSTSSLQFTFSQPATPSSTNTNTATTQPTTPSSFSFSAKVLHPQSVPLFGSSSFGQTSLFGDPKAKPENSTEESVSNQENTGDTNIFARLGKGTKRKEDPAATDTSLEKPVKEETIPAEGDAPRHPPKRPLLRSRGSAGGLFARALSDLIRKPASPVRQEAVKETLQLASECRETEKVGSLAHRDHIAALPPRAQAPTREVLEKAGESDSTKPSVEEPEKTTPTKRSLRRESSESLSGLSPADCTIIQCKNVPPALNKKEIIEKHFGHFGKVRRVFCRPNKKLAIVHFHDYASAAKAKKKGKILHRHELLLFWQRKKQSPGEKGKRPTAGEEQAQPDRHTTESEASSSPLRKPALRAPAVGSAMTFSRSSPVKKPSLAKPVQFDSEPQQEATVVTQRSDQQVPPSLFHLIGQVAETAEEKYRLLEQRDKILRQGRPKLTDLDLSKVFVGTCPDMCPEKERYMRETRNQLSVFEVTPDTETVDHMAAIKEYSRSSADQEEPLPHELRPLPILSMTMDYLVIQIMDQGHDNYRDWYDFVWNRTRGIRKDITQQHLCCPQTVSLIEKCTRFHVHCAHHLCEEHMMTFDAKINNENMTKCLQSLKEMYQDLAMRQIYCPCEAEFRQYNVLLKLNDGDILREVQQFRDEVRNSMEVKFAVQAFAALNSNNFVRFFKLVKRASYLPSCLLHRYFNQVRAKALRTLNIAHTVGSQRSTAFPVEDMVRMLMFRDAAEATNFFQQYGLDVNDGVVELSRIAYQEPELSLRQKKSEAILEKRTVLIGEVVNGGPLPNPPQHTPFASFDSQNKYRGGDPLAEPTPSVFRTSSVATTTKLEVKGKMEAEKRLQLKPAKLLPESRSMGEPEAGSDATKTTATDETEEPSEASSDLTIMAEPHQLFQPVAPPQLDKPPSPPPKPQPVYSDEEILAELESMVEEVVEAAVSEVASTGANYASIAVVESGGQVEMLVSEVVGQMLQEMSSTEIRLEQEHVAEEKRKQEETRRRQEHEAFLTQFSLSLCTEIIQEVLDKSIRETAASEIQEAVKEKAERLARCTEQLCASLVEETLDGEIALLAEDILETELQLIYKYIKRWRDVVAVRRQLKRQMRGFPAAPCCVDPRFKLKALAPSAPSQPSLEDLSRGVVNLGNTGTLAVSSTRSLKMRQEVLHQMRVHYYYQRLLDESVWAPLDLPALVAENIPNPPDRIFWKAALLLPNDHESVASLADKVLSDWLEAKFGGNEGSEVGKKQPDGSLQTLYVTSVLQENRQRTHKVHISIKVAHGPLTEEGLSKLEECCELQGTGALLMLLPAMPALAPEVRHEDKDVPLLSALLQLKQLQQASPWHCPLPLVILMPGPANTDPNNIQKLEEALMLQELVGDSLISEYIFFHIPETTSDLQGSQQLNQAMLWLLARAPPPHPLSCQTLVQFVEAGLSHEFSTKVCSHRQERADAGLSPQDPAPVIQLYNSVVAHLADTVSSQDLSTLSWPPEEFYLPDHRDLVPHLGWNSAQHLAWLHKAILSLQIPEWKLPSITASWSQLCSSIYCYASQIPVSRHSKPLLMSRLDNLLERVRLRSQWSQVAMDNGGARDESGGSAFHQIPLDDVLMLCIDHKLKDWRSPGSLVCEDAMTDDGEILVYFLTESLKGFQPPEEWLQAIKCTHKEKQQETEVAGAASYDPSSNLSLTQRLFQSLTEPDTLLAAPLDITHTPTPEELLSLHVLQSFEEEKAQSQRSMEQLQHWQNANPLDYFSVSLFMPSSTLLSVSTLMPQASKTRGSPLQQEVKPDDSAQKVDWPKNTPVSMACQLKELKRQIMASQEEELACRLKLNGLLSVVDD